MVSIVSLMNSGQTDISTINIESQLSTLGIPSEVIAEGPEAVEEYASENGITLPEPPAKAEEGLFDESSKTAESTKTDSSTSTSKSQPNEDMKQQLIAAGIPENVIAEGPGAVMAYANENGIDLPPPPALPEGLNEKDLSEEDSSSST